MERYYSYAGVNICIHGDDEIMYENDRMLASFRTKYLENCHHFYFERVDKVDNPSGELVCSCPTFCEYKDSSIIRYMGSLNGDYKNAFLRIEHRDMNHYVQVKTNYRIGTHIVYLAIESERLIAEKDGFLLHSSYIGVNGKGVLFTAPSGTGKSTQADLWVKYRDAEIINGDRSAICKVGDIYYSMGVPFSGSSNICKNITLPLSCIVYLAQAKSTRIRKMEGYEAFKCLWEGIGVNLWDKKNADIISNLVSELISQVPIYYLECTPDESAVLALERMLKDES